MYLFAFKISPALAEQVRLRVVLSGDHEFFLGFLILMVWYVGSFGFWELFLSLALPLSLSLSPSPRIPILMETA